MKIGCPSMDHNLSISGGTDKTQYIVSGSFLDQKGLIRHGKDTFQRYTLNGRITSNITDWFTLGYSTKWTREDYDRPSYLRTGFVLPQCGTPLADCTCSMTITDT